MSRDVEAMTKEMCERGKREKKCDIILVCKNSMLCDDGVILSVRILKWAKFFPCMGVSLKSYDGFVKRFRLSRCCLLHSGIVKWKRYIFQWEWKASEKENGEESKEVRENRSHEIYKRSKCLILTLFPSLLLCFLSLSKMKYSEQTIKQFMSLGMHGVNEHTHTHIQNVAWTQQIEETTPRE